MQLNPPGIEFTGQMKPTGSWRTGNKIKGTLPVSSPDPFWAYLTAFDLVHRLPASMW